MAARECSSRSRSPGAPLSSVNSRPVRCRYWSRRTPAWDAPAGETGRLDPGRRDTAAVFALHLVSRAPVSRARSPATMLVSVPGGGGSSETATTGRWARMRATSRTAVLAGRGLFGDPG